MYPVRREVLSADDVYVSTLLGALEQIDAGVTTLYDWSHIMNTPDHAERAIDGLSGLGNSRRVRSRHAGRRCGALVLPEPPAAHPQDIVRLRRTRLASDDALVTLGMSIRGPRLRRRCGEPGRYRTCPLARDHGQHASRGGNVWRIRRSWPRPGAGGASRSRHQPDPLQSTEGRRDREGRGLRLEHTVTPENADGSRASQPPGKSTRRAGESALGTDVVCSVSADMFSQMRFAVQTQRMLANAAAHEGGGMLRAIAGSSRDALTFATIEGARALRLDSRIGSITPGKDADVTVLSWSHERSCRS